MVRDGVFLGKRYEVLSKIGAGGMADVYKGRDIMLNRYVAIKVLKKAYREDQSFVQKFKSEAQSAAGLLDPNIVNVYDVGEDRGLYYMVMELVEGTTLKEYIEKKGRISHREAISIAIQVCYGIRAAHAAGIIHRDIKPHNIIISKDGRVKVTDFGIAKAVTSNTVTFNAMGSVHYSSPEQVGGRYSDQKSDIYSIGITLYEMVTGELPFDGESTVEVAMKHFKEDMPYPSDIVPSIPFSLEQIILKCTQKNVERRYKNTEGLIQDLKRSLANPDGDFVVIPPLENAQTVILTERDLDKIKNSYIKDSDETDTMYDTMYPEDSEEVDSDSVNPRMNKVVKIMTIVAAILIGLVFIFLVGRATGLFKSVPAISTKEEKNSKEVKVPSVVGLSEEEARTTLNKKGLGFKVVARKESEQYEEGIVSKQNQKAGTKVGKNTTVEVTVSAGLIGQEIQIPSVNGMNESEAQQALKNAGFKKVSFEYVYSDAVGEGEVVETTPSIGTKATKETAIVVKVSKGGEKKLVPSVEGSSLSQAQSALQQEGFVVGNVSYEYSNKVANNVVITQSVKTGKKVPKGTAVDLVVSQGQKPAENVPIPPVVGTYLENAKQLLIGNGLKVGNVSYSYSDYPAGLVIDSSPLEGNTVPEGTAINLEVSKGYSSDSYTN